MAAVDVFPESLEQVRELLSNYLLPEGVLLEEEAAEISCEQCGKGYKTKSGLKRHVNAKHSQTTCTTITTDEKQFKSLIKKAALKLSSDQNFDADKREAFSAFIVTDSESKIVYDTLKHTFSLYNKPQKFFSEVYLFLQPNKDKLFHTLSRFDSILLTTELANICLEFLTAPSEKQHGKTDIHFTDKDISIIQYLSGYCCRKICTKIQKSTKNSKYSQQCMAVLQAAKCDSDEAQVFVDTKDRGGLWFVNPYMHNIFKICEKEFQLTTTGFQTQIDREAIVTATLKNNTVSSSFDTVCGYVDFPVDKDVRKDLLYSLLHLYVHLRSHSFAKKLREQHKQKMKEGKQKALRTEFKRADKVPDEG